MHLHYLVIVICILFSHITIAANLQLEHHSHEQEPHTNNILHTKHYALDINGAKDWNIYRKARLESMNDRIQPKYNNILDSHHRLLSAYNYDTNQYDILYNREYDDTNKGFLLFSTP